MPKSTKPVYLSKGLLLGVVTILAALAQSRFGWGWAIDADLQLALVGVLVVIVRLVTKDGVRFTTTKPGTCPECGVALRMHPGNAPCTPKDK